MPENVSRRGFLRRCVAAAVAAPALPSVVEAEAKEAPTWKIPIAHPIGEYANEMWNNGFSTRYLEAFFGTATHDYHFSGWVYSDIRPTPRPKAPGLEWLVTEDRGPDVLPISICG